jgi:site-specific recombinase XerD
MQELADFLRFCALERRLAPMTCSAYERDVSACLAHLQGQGIRDLGEVRVTHLRAFLADEQRTRPAVSSQARATAALKCFFRFLMEEERLERDPALPLRTPKKREVLPDVLTLGELEWLLAQPGRGDVWERHFPGKPERDRLMLALMAYGGLRRAELVGLDWDDVNLARRLLRVRKAKGGRQRTIPIYPALAPLFAEYYASGCRSRTRRSSSACRATASTTPSSDRCSGTSRRQRRRRAQAHHPAHAPARIRHRAATSGREPAPDRRAARTQAPRLNPALHPRERTRAPRRRQAAALGRRSVTSDVTDGSVFVQLRRDTRFECGLVLPNRRRGADDDFSGTQPFGGVSPEHV